MSWPNSATRSRSTPRQAQQRSLRTRRRTVVEAKAAHDKKNGTAKVKTDADFSLTSDKDAYKLGETPIFTVVSPPRTASSR